MASLPFILHWNHKNTLPTYITISTFTSVRPSNIWHFSTLILHPIKCLCGKKQKLNQYLLHDNSSIKKKEPKKVFFVDRKHFGRSFFRLTVTEMHVYLVQLCVAEYWRGAIGVQKRKDITQSLSVQFLKARVDCLYTCFFMASLPDT